MLGLGVSTSHGVVPKEAAVAAQVSKLYPLASGQRLQVWFDLFELVDSTETRVAVVRLRAEAKGSIDLQRQEDEDLLVTRTRYHRRGAVSAGSEALSGAPAWVQLLAGRGFSKTLRSLGVVASDQGLALADDDTICVVLGARRGRDKPQVHVDRASGRVRRILSRDSQGQMRDILLRGQFEGAETLRYLPAEIVVKQGSDTVKILRTRKAMIDAIPPSTPTASPSKISAPL